MIRFVQRFRLELLLVVVATAVPCALPAQPLGQPDRDGPGDRMIQAYLGQEAAKIAGGFSNDLISRSEWEAKRSQYVREYYYMLGLDGRPEKTSLEATITGTLERDEYVVDLLHYQSRPGLYVTGNLYRPRNVEPGAKLPAVYYVCGHSHRGRNGNKVAYQSHGIWFARHGYICLVVDSLQLGEIAATHHGTYNLGRWWWHARGYTPAGVEAWNGVRGIDYLTSRRDVDPHRIAVTGISGGGAATFWIAAADERVHVAVPVSGMADLQSYIPNRVINGHCDCMFLYNTFRWPWTRIAGLVAPRPMLFVNSDQDAIFPMDANERIINRLERLYSLYGESDQVDAVVSVGGHAYRQDIRQAAYRFMNTHFFHDARRIADSEIDVVSEGGNPGPYPIPPEALRVFPSDDDLPADELNTRIDEHFVPVASVAMPSRDGFDQWRESLLTELRRVTFGYFPASIPPAESSSEMDGDTLRLSSEKGIEYRLRFPSGGEAAGKGSVLLAVLNEDEAGTTPDWIDRVASTDSLIVLCEPRGVGATRWTTKDPPNYVERSHVLLGRTVDAGRVWDVIAAVGALKQRSDVDGGDLPVHVAGSGRSGLIGAYAAVLDDRCAGVTVVNVPSTHQSNLAPRLLNVLRVCDVPDVLGLVAPRPLTLVDSDAAMFSHTVAAYAAVGAMDQLTFR